jgi:hypothetical protein
MRCCDGAGTCESILFKAEGRGLAHVKRVASSCCVYFVRRKTEIVAFGQISKISVYTLLKMGI